MKEIYSNIIQFRGSHYDFGLMQGEMLKHSPILENRERVWRVRRPRFVVDERETKMMIERFIPGVWAELIGIQDALKLPLQKILRDFGGYQIPVEKSGCSVFTSEHFLVRNYDFHPKTYEGTYAVFQPDDTGYATIGPAQRTIGRMDGMNEFGLAMGYNSIHSRYPGSGFVCWMIGRMILETCKTVHDAVDLLKEIPHSHSFSYIVLDQSGQSYIIEVSPRSMAVRESNACTNHFEILTEENRNYLTESESRLNAISKQSETAKDAYSAFRIFNDTDKNVFSKQYHSWAGTIHTSVYLPLEKEAWMALGGDTQPVKFNFSSWLEGENIQEQRIYGNVDTNLSFAHMDRV